MPTLPVHTNTAASAPHAWRDWLWSLLLHAAVLGVSVGTVKSHSHAALRRLRDDLGPDRVSMTEDRS